MAVTVLASARSMVRLLDIRFDEGDQLVRQLEIRETTNGWTGFAT
jgi:hypothetical protein